MTAGNSESGGLTDLHSHLVPGVDDGATSMEETLESVGRMVERGIRTIVTTPHLLGSLTLDDAAIDARLAEISESFEAAKSAVRDRFPQVTFLLGTEVLLDRPDVDLRDPRIHLGDSRFVLVEWPQFQVPPSTERVLEDVRSQGVQVLIAHAERYRGYTDDLGIVKRWRAAGAFLQVNYGSLSERYGPQARALALRLLEYGWVDCLASDFHGRPHLDIYLERARQLFVRMGAEEHWNLLTQANPTRISRGEPPLAVPPLEISRGLLDRIRMLLRG